MSQRYKNDSSTQITINHNELVVLDVHVPAILEYLEGLFAKGVIGDFDEIVDSYDGLIEIVLNDELNDDSAIMVKKQVSLLRETILLMKRMLTRHSAA